MPFTESIEVVEPTASEIEAARRSSERMAEITENLESKHSSSAVRLPALGKLELPVSAVRALARILSELAEGRAVTVHALTEDVKVTTSQAAEVLGMSRPTLVGLLERGEIPYRMVGTHRRLRLSEVLAYKARMERGAPRPHATREARLRGLSEMAEYTDRLGLGY